MDPAKKSETPNEEGTGRAPKWRVSFAARGRELVTECDRWFVGAFHGLAKGTHWATNGLGALGRRLVPRAWTRRRARRERIRRVLLAEAKRADLQVSDEDLRLFMENMATVLELVLGGVIGIDDIAFEQDPSARPGNESNASPAYTAGPATIDAHCVPTIGQGAGPGSAELGQEVTDAHEHGQYQEEPAL
jgi:hypothetical protein